MRQYDEIQKSHYNKVALEKGSNSGSTMPDLLVRDAESESIVSAILAWLRHTGAAVGSVRIADLGCGNGTTLSVLSKSFPSAEVFGVEYNQELLKIAQSVPNVEVVWGDLVDGASLPVDKFDVVVLQRVIINIQDHNHQISALENIVNLIKPGGLLVAIEAFETGLWFMNEARREFNLPSVGMPYHNLFLPDGFFQNSDCLENIDLGVVEHFLSTHYYLSYVVYPALAAATDGAFNRNSVFVKMMGQMLPNVGSFGSNRFQTFRKIDNARSL